MKLSIITINLNNRDGLEKTIKSVNEQTFTDFEYIVVDGKSNDGSVAVIKQYDNLINKWISEEDNGIYSAMNKGIQLAQGEYCLFLNSGDVLRTKDVLNNVFSHNPTSDIVYAECNYIQDGNVYLHRRIYPPITFSLFYHSSLDHQATFIKRDLFRQYGLYREDLRFVSDWEFWIRTILMGDASTEGVDVILTDFNMDGVSYLPENSQIMHEEKEKVYDEYVFIKKVIPDYKEYEHQIDTLNKQLHELNWLKRRKFVYRCIHFLYTIALRRKSHSKQ